MGSRLVHSALSLSFLFAAACDSPETARPTPRSSGVALLEAIKKLDDKEATRLIEGGAIVDFQDPADNTPLHYAAGLGCTDIVRLLVKHRANVNPPNSELDTPLHWAALGGHEESLKILIASGAMVDSKSKSGETSLHLAVDKGHLEAVRILLENDASLELSTSTGETTLDYASHKIEIHDYLISNGALDPLQESQSIVEPELKNFRFSNKPIHPKSVELLLIDLADTLPTVAAVDLEGFLKSNRSASKYKEENGVVRYEHDKTDERGEYFLYRHLGLAECGTHVLRTASGGSGSGIFMSLLFIRFERDTVFEDGTYRNRTLMKCAGSIDLGDRDDGIIVLRGNELTIGSSRYRQESKVLLLK